MITTCPKCNAKNVCNDQFANEDKIGLTCDVCGHYYIIIGYVGFSEGEIITTYNYENKMTNKNGLHRNRSKTKQS